MPGPGLTGWVVPRGVHPASLLTPASFFQLLPSGARVLRVSPNLPCVVQEGAMVMARGRCVGSSEAQLLQTLLEACGQCQEVPEAFLDIHTGLSGSGVAFVSVPLSLEG